MRVTPSMPYDELPEMLTVKEASTWLAMHINEIYRLIHSGDLQAIKPMGKRFRIQKAALRTWLDRSTINPS